MLYSRAQEDLLDNLGLVGSAEDRDCRVLEVHLDPGEPLEKLEDQVGTSKILDIYRTRLSKLSIVGIVFIKILKDIGPFVQLLGIDLFYNIAAF